MIPSYLLSHMANASASPMASTYTCFLNTPRCLSALPPSGLSPLSWSKTPSSPVWTTPWPPSTSPCSHGLQSPIQSFHRTTIINHKTDEVILMWKSFDICSLKENSHFLSKKDPAWSSLCHLFKHFILLSCSHNGVCSPNKIIPFHLEALHLLFLLPRMQFLWLFVYLAPFIL